VTIEVEASARLHLGFLDLAGDLGRRFGSLGVTLDDIATRVRVERAAADRIDAPAADRVAQIVARLRLVWPVPPVRIEIREAIPAHVGLGSGTQLGLALGCGVARLLGRDDTPETVGALLERGARSGIGIGAFAQGGVLLDGGRGDEDGPPPIVARLPWPEQWRLLLLFDPAGAGLHGAAERAAFVRLPAMATERAGELCRLTLMGFLPAVALGDEAAAGRALGALQRILGDHFAPAQGGRFTSRAVSERLAWLEAAGVAGVGQSSWGPTGFALVGSEDAARELRAGLESHFADNYVSVTIAKGRNHGARVVRLEPVPAQRRRKA
jgi:beta-RFAP synthase